MKPHFIVVDLDGNETEVIRSFGEVLASQKEFPAFDDGLTIQERLNRVVGFQCYAALRRTGGIAPDLSFDDWVNTIADILDPPDDEDEDDPLGTTGKG